MLVELDKTSLGIVISGITTFTIGISFLIGKHTVAQGIWLSFATYLLTGDRPSFIYACIRSFPRDIRAALYFLKMNVKLKIWEKNRMTVAKLFQESVRRHPKKEALEMGDEKLTFQDVEDLSNQVAAYFKAQNLQRGDTVALLMENRPEYSCIWLGLSKIGVITALINTNLRKLTLVHSIKVANSKAVIVATDLAGAINEISNEDGVKGLKIYQYYDNHDEAAGQPLITDAVNLYQELKRQPRKPLTEEIAKGSIKDKMVYIYTSGTTGMPKAAVITNLRYMFMSVGCHCMLTVREDDRIYNPLPLYHTAGGILGMGNVLIFGVTMVLRKKFSASNFWTDCIKAECTVAQYIGEICRYLLSTPSKPTDNQHKIRLMFGNGLRPQIWKQFVNRFDVKEIGEVYGSTEGNSNLINIDSTVGAVGFIPRFAKKLYPVLLVKCCDDGEPIRNAQGLCQSCKPGEMGVLLGKINPKKAVISFEGYADKSASEKKIIHDVFKKGDAFFNSGDILVMDLLGYFYFKDRTGDTFRWRGENVSTSEVEAVISNVVGLHDCVVYGVDIPHVEGKAGMAAIADVDNQIDLEQLSAGIRGSLAPYARPIFIRLLKELPMTGTFKLKKRDLQLEGYDIHKIKDPIYFLHGDGVFRQFTEKDYNDVLNGRARL